MARTSCTGTVNDPNRITRFEKMVLGFLDPSVPLIPMRFVQNSDVVEDRFVSALVDLDDLNDCNDWGFRAVVVHLLTERNFVPGYASRLDTAALFDTYYKAAHLAARAAEATMYQYFLRDETIFLYRDRDISAPPPWLIVFHSKQFGYELPRVRGQAQEPNGGSPRSRVRLGGGSTDGRSHSEAQFPPHGPAVMHVRRSLGRHRGEPMSISSVQTAVLAAALLCACSAPAAHEPARPTLPAPVATSSAEPQAADPPQYPSRAMFARAVVEVREPKVVKQGKYIGLDVGIHAPEAPASNTIPRGSSTWAP